MGNLAGQRDLPHASADAPDGPTRMTQPLLAFERVALRRGGRLLFQELDLTVSRGEGLHISGPNGSGKSSLIRLAAGLLSADAGTVRGSPLALADDKLALDRELPLRKALLFWGPAQDDVDRALAATALTSLADVPVRLLSTGQAKRATLARVAALGAPLWLLDEPLNGLDAAGADALATLLAQHRSSGGAVVAASHLPLPGEWKRLELRP